MDEIEKCCLNVLKNYFGYDSFRPLQLDIIKSVLKGKDTLAIMPTGGGKSICYQIPALIFKGVTIVITPLISLMQDQVYSLVENGIEAVYLNSTLEWENYIEIVKEIKKGEVKLVYLSPEALCTERIQSIFHEIEGGISCITIDEAHCISSWGHDFRPDYLEIARIRHQFPSAVCLALTATATKQVRDDIAANLQMQNPEVFISSFNRENIFIQVKPKKQPLLQVIEFLEEHKDQSGIIYCFSRKQVDSLYLELLKKGYSVLNYHAGLNDAERTKNQDLFVKDKVKIIVATIAFGMGINKPNVRFVIHYDLPKSIEGYYQEIGRAGRDGLQSEALLLYSAQDVHKIRFFFKDSAEPEKSEILLKGMINFATARTCRRRLLLAYFGENYQNSVDKNSCCDICAQGDLEKSDVTVPSQKLMSCILRVDERYGLSYIIDILLGSKQKRILENNHDSLSTWGIGKEFDKNDWFELSSALLDEGYIQKTGEYNIVKLLPKGKNALFSREKIALPVILHKQKVLNQIEIKKKSGLSLPKKGDFIKTLNQEDLGLYTKIRDWRKKTAEESNVPPYVIFGDKTLEELILKKPHTNTELLEVFGIGQAKAEKIGSQILRLLND